MIERGFELKFLLKFIGSITVGFIIIITALYFVLPHDDVLNYYEAVTSFINTSDALVRTFIIAGIIEVVFIIVIINFISIFASHKLAGPAYRLGKILENFADGDLTQTVRFRNYDPLKEVEHVFNNTLKEFTQKLKAIDETNNSMNKAREELDGTAESIEKFKEKISILEKEIEKFTL